MQGAVEDARGRDTSDTSDTHLQFSLGIVRHRQTSSDTVGFPWGPGSCNPWLVQQVRRTLLGLQESGLARVVYVQVRAYVCEMRADFDCGL